MDFIARVNPKYLAVASCFMAQNDVRYYLNGVCIRPHAEKGVVIVGTNGHCLGAMYDPAGFAEREIIIRPSKRVLAACKLKSWNGTFTPSAVWIAERCAAVSAAMGWPREGDEWEAPELFGPLTIETAACDIIDGKFPDFRKVAKATEAKGSDVEDFPWMQVAVMEKFMQAAKILGGKTPCFHTIPNGPRASAQVRIEALTGEQHFFGLAMPISSKLNPLRQLPEWMQPNPN